MSWEHDTIAQLQSQLNRVEAENAKFKALFQAFRDRPQDSREIVLKELEDMSVDWLRDLDPSCDADREALDDAETMRVIAALIRGIE